MAPSGGRREGAGRKPKDRIRASVRVSFRLPFDLHAAVVERAQSEGVTVTDALIAIVRAALTPEP